MTEIQGVLTPASVQQLPQFTQAGRDELQLCALAHLPRCYITTRRRNRASEEQHLDKLGKSSAQWTRPNLP